MAWSILFVVVLRLFHFLAIMHNKRNLVYKATMEHCFVLIALLLHSFYTVITLLCCYYTVIMLLHCYHTYYVVITLSTQFLHCYYTCIMLLLHCCYTVAEMGLFVTLWTLQLVVKNVMWCTRCSILIYKQIYKSQTSVSCKWRIWFLFIHKLGLICLRTFHCCVSLQLMITQLCNTVRC